MDFRSAFAQYYHDIFSLFFYVYSTQPLLSIKYSQPRPVQGLTKQHIPGKGVCVYGGVGGGGGTGVGGARF